MCTLFVEVKHATISLVTFTDKISNSLRLYYVRDKPISQICIGIIFYIIFHFYHKFTNIFFYIWGTYEISSFHQSHQNTLLILKKPIDLIIHKRKNFYRMYASKKTEWNNRLLFHLKKSYHSTCNYCRRLNDVTDLES